MFVFDKNNMVLAEKEAFKSGVSQETLMEKAGNSAAEVIASENDLKNKNIAVVCGKGNNAGDGFIIAKSLYKMGAFVTVILSFEDCFSSAAKTAFEKMPKGIKKVYATDNFPLIKETISKSDIIIDALFGIGFKGKATAVAEKLIEDINSSNGYVYSVDVPSGLEADSGKVNGLAVRADCTITFEALKPCHILPPANSYCGQLQVQKIGIEKEILNKITPFCRVIEHERLPKTDKNAHKGTEGTTVSVCGSYGMPGAAILAAKAALRGGVGKLFAVTPPENYTAMAVSVPEAVIIPANFYKDINLVLEKLPTADSVLIGCGIGVSDEKKQAVRQLICSAACPVIIDADGINCIYNDIDFIKKVKADIVLTPHSGEMARLVGVSIDKVEENRTEIASRFAKEYGVYLCLKGANTLVAAPNGELYVNLTGTPALATAGSGDVLSGIISSLIAQGLDTLSAVTRAVYIHGLAGEMVAAEKGERGLLAGDLTEKVPYLL